MIEASETDEAFFDMNPLVFWKRSDAMRHGFESVSRTLVEHREVLGPLFERYGLEFRPPGTPAGESTPDAPALRVVGERAAG